MVQPADRGGYGFSWSEAIRLGPAQILFITQSEEQAKSGGLHRNLRASGKSGRDLMKSAMERMAALRKKFAGVDSREEL